MEPFYQAIKKPDVILIMESYNEVNDVFITRNKELITHELKTKLIICYLFK